MNNDKTPPPSLTAATEHPKGWCRQLIDILSGPPPNESVLAKRRGKPFWCRYPVFLLGTTISLMLLVAPELANQWNRVPEPSTLQTLQVRVLKTSLTEPHLLVQLPDGQQRGMEWPIDVGLRSKIRSQAWTDAQRESLPGCLATVQGAPLGMTLTERFRIWSLDCPEKDIRIDFNTTSKSFAEDLRIRLLVWLCLLIITSVSHVVVFLREKRGHL